ncbi:MAG: hypothetical protein J5777_09025 [Clostridiales bacterium]|nr:hypothetical protein [Clostridiales bacterium]
MKHILRSISVFLASAVILPAFLGLNSEAATSIKIEGNFPDDNFKKVVKTYDTDNNGYLSASEISKVINIYCQNKNISSIKGVEYFTALQGLWCADNKIKSMDISKNKDLHGVWCSGNPLTSLDFSGNPELEWVYCFDCQLTKLDFSANPNMAYLECNTNPKLSTLILSDNPKLEHLMCGSCALTTLDLSANTNLTHLDAFRNKMTKLDISKNTKLKRLNIWDNPDLGNVSVSHLPELQFYSCANNGVTKLDVTHNPQLQKLVCSYNDLTSLDLSKNPRLAYLDCADNQLSKLDISNNPQLYFLQAFINNFTTLNIGNNSRLIKTYKDGTYKNETNVAGYSYKINYGGSNELGDELLYFLCVPNKCKNIVTTADNVKDLPDSTLDTKDGHSASEDFMTREMVIQTLYELAGSPSVTKFTNKFTDVESGAWYENALKWGQYYKISLGYPNVCSDTFGVGEYVTRQDLALMMHRYAAYKGYKTAFDYGRTDWFDDFKNIDYYAWGPFTWAIQWEYLLPGDSGKMVYPRGRVTRDELAFALKAMIKLNTGKAPSTVPIPSSDVNDLVMVPSKPATCTEDGNTAYWMSPSSGKFYKDALGKTEIAAGSWVIKKLGHDMVHVDAKAETCTDNGNIECFKCKRCEKYFTDSEGTTEIGSENVVIPAAGHKLQHTKAKAETCTEDGNSEYWTCTVCGKFFADSKGETEIKKDSWIIPAAHKGVDKIVPATFTEDGSVVTTCSACKKTIRNEVIPHINEIKLTAAAFTYSGVQPAFVKITDANGKTISPEHYTFVIKDGDGNAVKEAVNVGTYSVTVKFKGFYKGTSETMEFKINKKANTLKIKAGKKYKIKYSKLKKAKKTIAYTGVITFSSQGQGALTFTKKSGNKKITISKTGTVTVKKKLRKGTYKVKVKVRAAGDGNHAASSTKTVTFKIRVY